ncbi:hypothetical protein FBEOM_9343 [Fusarium beomiforme]|uniref:Lysine-specific metallo-endopeptidase domain-containing protein n=1 Tax=Fusarium beomiforme TaxID=44412 RepID=A0A9P5ADG5_9HYPO|nr:hypothetical protein FBEOM_9343 [Fusarium beomiforme]
MSCLQYPSLFICKALILVLLAHSALGSINDVFNVKGGSVTVGGCDAHKTRLTKWWDDVTTFVDAALLYAQDDSEDGVEYMYTWFALDAPPADAKERNAARVALSAVKDFIEGNGDEREGGKPWLFCSSKWLQELSWDDIAYDPDTGEKFPDDDDKSKSKKVRDVLKHPQHDPKNPRGFPFWSPDLRQYVLEDESGDYCSKKFEAGVGYYGSTSEDTTPTTVTICVQNMLAKKGPMKIPKESLTLGKVQKEGSSIVNFRTMSMTLFHELFHVALGVEATKEEEKSYDLKYIAKPRNEDGGEGDDDDGDFILTEDALHNPESYTYYALSCVLGQKNEKFTFASTKSKLKKPKDPKGGNKNEAELRTRHRRMIKI